MAGTKKLNMDKFKTSVKKAQDDHKDWTARIKQAVNDGEHKAANSAIKMLTKTRDSLHKLVEHVQTHSDKKKPKLQATK